MSASVQELRSSETLRQIAIGAFDEYDEVGYRVQDRPEEIGSTMTHLSVDYADDEEIGTLSGISAVDAYPDHLFPEVSAYEGDHVLVLGGYQISRGFDCGEIIMEEPVVIASFTCAELGFTGKIN
jgi:hypothetical protein